MTRHLTKQNVLILQLWNLFSAAIKELDKGLEALFLAATRKSLGSGELGKPVETGPEQLGENL